MLETVPIVRGTKTGGGEEVRGCGSRVREVLARVVGFPDAQLDSYTVTLKAQSRMAIDFVATGSPGVIYFISKSTTGRRAESQTPRQVFVRGFQLIFTVNLSRELPQQCVSENQIDIRETLTNQITSM